jgi:hypothetical protein
MSALQTIEDYFIRAAGATSCADKLARRKGATELLAALDAAGLAVVPDGLVAVPREALEPFARIWRINAPLSPDLQRPLADFIAGSWPKMEAAKALNDVLDAAKEGER